MTSREWGMVTTLALLTACGGGAKDTGEGEGEDPAAHACEQFGDPGTVVSGGPYAVSAEPITLSEEPWTVELVDDGTGVFTGFVKVEMEGDLATLLFSDTAGVVTGLSHNGTDVPLPAASPNADCPDDLPEHWDLDLEHGSWVLQLGPTSVDTAWLVWLEAAGHAHEE